jgi:hypothetical protein
MWTTQTEQGHYGHRARKKTWLCYVGARPPLPAIWGPSEQRARLDPGYHSKEERAAHKGENHRNGTRLTAKENRETPLAFAKWLISLAEQAGSARALETGGGG